MPWARLETLLNATALRWKTHSANSAYADGDGDGDAVGSVPLPASTAAWGLGLACARGGAGQPKRSIGPRARSGRRLAGGDDPGFVGEDDGLDAVSQVELGQDTGDVCLYRRAGDDELVGDFGVGESAGDESEDLELAVGELDERWRRGGCRAVRG
jgi:hypothetical protein